jgi:hypothetical protein
MRARSSVRTVTVPVAVLGTGLMLLGGVTGAAIATGQTLAAIFGGAGAIADLVLTANVAGRAARELNQAEAPPVDGPTLDGAR